MQRRLSGLERDLAAIQAKLDSLNQEADRIQDAKPEEAAAIREKITQITELWQELKTMVSFFTFKSILLDSIRKQNFGSLSLTTHVRK